MAVDQEFLRILKDKLNIVEVASSYVSTERRGGNWWACCPFHHEKTPSFSINESEQYYHCFGCGASGDVIKFVCEMENIDFIDAVKMLADRVKLPLPQTEFDSQKTFEQKRKRDTLLKIMNECAHFYLNNLNSGKADAHIEYILNRKIPSNMVRTFGLGASLNFNDLPKYLLSKGYSKQDLLDSGAVDEANGKMYDSLGGRLIYPIINAMGEVIAFGGRLLEQKPQFAKYKNTKDTLIFNKRKTLYNINLLKKLRSTQTIKEVIMVEGYMDTMSLYQAGFHNVVASMGTSLTQDQARLIKRYADTVLISYDGDGAGQKANMRGLEILKSEGLRVKVVPLTDNLDPDDIIKKYGQEGYQRCLDQAMPLIDYKLATVKKSFDLTKVEDKRRYVGEAIKIIKTSDSAAEQEDLLKTLRDETGFTFESLNRDLQSLPQEKVEKKNEPPVKRQDDSSMQAKASRFVLASFLFGAKYTQDYDISTIDFLDDVHKIIGKYILTKQLLEERVQISELLDFFDSGTREDEEVSRILDLDDGRQLNTEVSEKFFIDCLRQLNLTKVNQAIAEITQQIGQTDDLKERAQLAQQMSALLKQKEKIKSGVQK